jgi:hypothetical protein
LNLRGPNNFGPRLLLINLGEEYSRLILKLNHPQHTSHLMTFMIRHLAK